MRFNRSQRTIRAPTTERMGVVRRVIVRRVEYEAYPGPGKAVGKLRKLSRKSCLISAAQTHAYFLAGLRVDQF